ncbi:MAG: AMP-binding protein [Armatimonadota bacterium]|nr:AMP-binding protein [Armatimonadota bacterium]MDR7485961.1 AMP-binding protein [Armatimonadota bacterium]MDR7532161.1 AMP-binding protein [Armatimonadota bacterium]MDR7537303.1 AMP-binding protein [Armatimonadota bacterium]
MVLTAPRPATSLETVPGLFFAQAARRGPHVALRRKRYGLWQRTTWDDYAAQVRVVAHALLALGVQRGERVGVIGENRPEWLFADLGIQSIGAITTGIYTTSSPEQVHYILEHAGCRVFVVEGEEQLDKALEIRGRLPLLEHIVVMDPEGLRTFHDPQVTMWDQFRALGADHARRFPTAVDERLAQIAPDDVAVLMYTSGTTGPPKGVMLTHRNITWTTAAIDAANPLSEHDEVLSYLPLAHIAERHFSVFLPARWGYTVNFVEHTDTVLENLVEVAPTVFFGVPRVWEKLYSGICLRMQENDLLKRWAYHAARAASGAAVRRRLARRPVPVGLKIAAAVADRLVLLPLRRRLGLHRIRLAYSAGAPIAPELVEYFWTLGVPVREIYGQTEDCGPTTLMQGDDIRLGTVGRPLPGVEVRIAPDGEILVRGPNVFAGYFRDPEATAAALADGWLHSGDIGELDADGFLRITDRKKDLFITAGGKNIAPQYIENKLKASPYINDAVVIGDRRRYCVALVVIDEENVTRWAQDRRVPFTTYADLAARPEVYDLIKAEVAAVNHTLSSPEQVKKFALLPRRLYAEDGEVTPTLKVKRKAIMEKYADVVAELYRE